MPTFISFFTSNNSISINTSDKTAIGVYTLRVTLVLIDLPNSINASYTFNIKIYDSNYTLTNNTAPYFENDLSDIEIFVG